MMKRNFSLLALAIALPAAAFASGLSPKAEDQAKIHEILSGQGFEVYEVELEDGLYEVEASKDGLQFEVYMDAQFNILEMEEESDAEPGDD
ncbi:PepSY domain-containing protein [Roseobacter sp. SK209-2-6]|uniref:PepSY domain-containing protein n=1 Tax=Roseobacter sp. SK209-2-6 TaxID=388739 RepID=UPI00030DAC4E|nr:PepSY domain-containing protein [Roseobacter sp. SK209-2-6]